MKIYLSKKPKSIGGGSNTFTGLFQAWSRKHQCDIVRKIRKADIAIIIAHFADEEELRKAKAAGTVILHRLDEYFDQNEGQQRRLKHQKIIRINRFAHMTVFQSEFVFNNVYPHIKPERYCILYNGGDAEKFHPADALGNAIGHVTWSVHPRKRLDMLYDFIRTHPDEHFLLVGNHRSSPFDFNLPNVRMVGRVSRRKISRYYRMMKMLYFPAEKDPCSNTVVESILSGVPVCYHPDGGNGELVNGPVGDPFSTYGAGSTALAIDGAETPLTCGLPIDEADALLGDIDRYRRNCLQRRDLHFDNVFRKYFYAVKLALTAECG